MDGGGGVSQKVLFRVRWKCIFCIPGFENMSPGDGSGWGKEIHCFSECGMEVVFFFGFIFFFFIFSFMYIEWYSSEILSVTSLGCCCRHSRETSRVQIAEEIMAQNDKKLCLIQYLRNCTEF